MPALHALACQVGNNGIGIAGTALAANILACKALNSKGDGTISTVIRCLDVCRWAKNGQIIGFLGELNPSTLHALLLVAVVASTALTLSQYLMQVAEG
jgi:hypothetical protein